MGHMQLYTYLWVFSNPVIALIGKMSSLLSLAPLVLQRLSYPE